MRALLLGTAAMAWANGALAQTDAPAQSQAASKSASGQIQEVVVTALKHSSELEKTPLSMSAVTGETLADAGVTDVHGLLQSTPGLSFQDAGPSQTRVFMRGIQSIGEPTTGVYYDETPVPGAVGSSSDSASSTPLVKLFDVDRVEALRGPQGTLYGSGSMGGTLRVLFNKPTNKYEGAISTDFTDNERGGIGYDVQGMVNVPVLNNEFALRAVAYQQYNGGYIDDTFLNQKNVNTATAQGGRLAARYMPTDTLTVDGSVIYQRSYGFNPYETVGAGAYNSTAQTQLPYNDQLFIYNLTAHWDLGPILATAIVSDVHRKVISAAQDVSYFFDTDLNNPAVCTRFAGGGSPCTAAQQTSFNAFLNATVIPSALLDTQTVNNPTAEVRFSSNEKGFLDWTVGGFYSDRTTNSLIAVYRADPSSGALNKQNTLEARTVHDELKQFAGYGEGAAHLTDELTLTFGARYFDYQRTTGGATVVPLNLIGAALTPYSEVTGASEGGWVTKTNLSYQFNANLLGYASASQGFRPGGVNQNVPSSASGVPVAYLPDTDWDYEVGFKTNWFDHHLQFDIDGYLIDWNNMQTLGHSAVNSLYQIVANAGAAEIKGIEASLTAKPISGLTIQANGTIANGVLTSNQASSAIALGTGGVSGDRIPFLPDVTAGATAEYRWAITDNLGGMARIDEDYTSTSYSQFNNAAKTQTKVPAYALTNVRVGVEEDKWGLFLYVNNLFNRTAITYSYNNGALSGGKFPMTSAAPLTVGLNLRANF